MEERLYTITECAKECNKSVSSVYKTLKANEKYYQPFTRYTDKTYLTAEGVAHLKSNAHKKSQSQPATHETAKLLQEIDLLKNTIIQLQGELLKEKEYSKRLLEQPQTAPTTPTNTPKDIDPNPQPQPSKWQRFKAIITR